jgi:NAD(P)-dependent dehydrogenase (short-subunit alcohol dehydrogenase family)
MSRRGAGSRRGVTDGLAVAAAEVDHAVGRVDVLVNNAAIH